MREETLLFFFDVDNFKQINDTYGHAYGDHALEETGAAIDSVFGKEGHCYRIGGDEFCAMVRKTEESAQRYLSYFEAEIKHRRAEDRRLPGVSVGYGSFVPGKGSVADAVKKADAMMYEYKRNRK